jgi:hypothetical protein
MSLYKHTVSQIEKGKKNNLTEKLQGSCKYEFETLCSQLETKFHLQPKNLMGLGTSCIVYQLNDNQVVKVCSKKIKFFHGRKTRVAKELQKTTDPLVPYFLPIQEVIYDGDQFFAYTQAKCKPLPKKKAIKTHDLIDVLKIIRVMLSNQILVGQIKPKNVGYWNHQLVLFDYHSMHQLYDRMKEKPDWYGSLVDALETYNSLYKDHSKGDLKKLAEMVKKSKSHHDINEVIKYIDHIIS